MNHWGSYQFNYRLQQEVGVRLRTRTRQVLSLWRFQLRLLYRSDDPVQRSLVFKVNHN